MVSLFNSPPFYSPTTHNFEYALSHAMWLFPKNGIGFFGVEDNGVKGKNAKTVSHGTGHFDD
jgi:hypothetical protein